MPPTANSLPLIGEHNLTCGLFARSANLFIAVLYGISMVFVGLATAVQVWTLNLHYKGARGQMVPAWVKKLVLGHIASALCIRIVHREATDDLPDASKPVWRSDKGTMTDAGTTSQPVRENVSNQDFTVLHVRKELARQAILPVASVRPAPTNPNSRVVRCFWNECGTLRLRSL